MANCKQPLTFLPINIPNNFFTSLVSGQLDVDRMDYLTRDSFFTGVSEGVIGYDRIIKMLTVKDGELDGRRKSNLFH